jgi:hypothetical protein
MAAEGTSVLTRCEDLRSPWRWPRRKPFDASLAVRFQIRCAVRAKPPASTGGLADSCLLSPRSKPMALWLPDLPTLVVEFVLRERAVVGVTKRSKGRRTRLLPGRIHVARGLARHLGRITKWVMRKRLLVGAVEGFDDRVNCRPRNGRESKERHSERKHEEHRGSPHSSPFVDVPRP